MEKPVITMGDRIAAAFVMFIASAITSIGLWSVLIFILLKLNINNSMAFSLVYYFTGFFTILAFMFPDLALKMMAGIWKRIDRFLNLFLHR